MTRQLPRQNIKCRVLNQHLLVNLIALFREYLLQLDDAILKRLEFEIAEVAAMHDVSKLEVAILLLRMIGLVNLVKARHA